MIMTKENTILLVDDDLTLREMYEERLKQEGYLVIGASDGVDALKRANEDKPDLIILDIMMPKLNGIDVMNKLRSEEKTKNIPVIVLTALVQEVDKLKNYMGPNDSYLIKSKEMPKDVIEKVQNALSSKKTEK